MGNLPRVALVEWYQNRRIVLDHYGRRCACCSSKDYLEIDHIDGDGKCHRESLMGQSLESWLIEQDFPPGFQILCQRCNGNKSNGATCRLNHRKKNMSEDNGLRPKTRSDLKARLPAVTHKRKQVFGSIKESNYEWLRQQRETTHKSIGEILDPLIERAIAEAEETDQLASVSLPPAKSYKYLDIEVDQPRLCPISDVVMPERPSLGRRMLAWLFRVRT